MTAFQPLPFGLPTSLPLFPPAFPPLPLPLGYGTSTLPQQFGAPVASYADGFNGGVGSGSNYKVPSSKSSAITRNVVNQPANALNSLKRGAPVTVSRALSKKQDIGSSQRDGFSKSNNYTSSNSISPAPFVSGGVLLCLFTYNI